MQIVANDRGQRVRAQGRDRVASRCCRVPAAGAVCLPRRQLATDRLAAGLSRPLRRAALRPAPAIAVYAKLGCPTPFRGRKSVSVSPDLAEQRLGSPCGPVRGTPGGAGSTAGLPLRKQVALGRSWLFLQPNNSQCDNCQIRNTRTSTASVIPSIGIAANGRPILPKPKLSPVPPVLSGPDQARLFPQVEEPRARSANTDNRAIIRHAHCDNSRINWQPPTVADFAKFSPIFHASKAAQTRDSLDFVCRQISAPA